MSTISVIDFEKKAFKIECKRSKHDMPLKANNDGR